MNALKDSRGSRMRVRKFGFRTSRSDRQDKLLVYVIRYRAEHGYTPTHQEISSALGIPMNSVGPALALLRDQKLIAPSSGLDPQRILEAFSGFGSDELQVFVGVLSGLVKRRAA